MTGLMEGKRGLIMGVANDHSIAWGIARTLHAHGDPEQVGPRVFVHVGHVGEVLPGHHQHMPRIDGGDIHEGKGDVVLIYHTGRRGTGID